MTERRVIFPSPETWTRNQTGQEHNVTNDDQVVDDLRWVGKAILDDLRRIGACIEQAGTPEDLDRVREECDEVLSSWADDPNTYSDGTVVSMGIYDAGRTVGSHVHAPPHRRGYATTEGN